MSRLFRDYREMIQIDHHDGDYFPKAASARHYISICWIQSCCDLVREEESQVSRSAIFSTTVSNGGNHASAIGTPQHILDG
jgi:hypothetical protein